MAAMPWPPPMHMVTRHTGRRSGDAMVGALADPFDGCHMGMTAKNVAVGYHVSQDGTPLLVPDIKGLRPVNNGP